jgi:glycosyltransferase involved in cell wall biosynthesis
MTIKIAYIVGALPYGGIESLLLDIVTTLKNSDTRLWVINLSGVGMKKPEFIGSGVSVIDIGSSKKDIKTFDFRTLIKLRKTIKHLAPDIVHTMHFSADYFGRLAALGTGIPVITHIHNTKSEIKFHRRIANKFLSFTTKLFISVSNDVHRYVQNAHNLAKKKSIVLYNAIKFSKLDHTSIAQDIASKTAGQNIIAVARLEEQKNFDLLLKALVLLIPRFPHIHMIFVGEGPERENLEKFIHDQKITEYVTLTGYRDDVGAFLKASHIFVLPSDYEGFGIAPLEAMYCGLPIIISTNVPLQEIAGEAALICQVDEFDIAAKIASLLENKEMYSQMSIQGKNIANQFGIEQYCRKLLSIYQCVLDNYLKQVTI